MIVAAAGATREDAHITATQDAIATGDITIVEETDLDLAMVHVPASWATKTVHRFSTTDATAAHPYAVHNATERFAVMTLGAGPPEMRYRYETWVHYMSRRPQPRVDLTGLAEALTERDTGTGQWVFDGIGSLNPALHLVGAETTSITDPDFVALVTAALQAATSTWNPYPD